MREQSTFDGRFETFGGPDPPRPTDIGRSDSGRFDRPDRDPDIGSEPIARDGGSGRFGLDPFDVGSSAVGTSAGKFAGSVPASEARVGREDWETLDDQFGDAVEEFEEIDRSDREEFFAEAAERKDALPSLEKGDTLAVNTTNTLLSERRGDRR